jgi:ABC-type uncharacterized transport system ATPase subunit
VSTLEVKGITKRYGAVAALTDVQATFQAGEIHAVLGENGAGKSTLVGILAGFVKPDQGVATLDQKPLPLGNPVASRRAGIAMVHQHFMLVPEFTVEENLALDRMGKLAGALDTRSLIMPALELAERLGWRIEPRAIVRELPVGVQQRIEILKTLADDGPVAIFDEPTAVLSADETRDLFRILRKLKDAQKTVVLIAHKLSEVMAVADRVTVLRKGKVVAASSIESTDEAQLATWMVGEFPSQLTKSTRNAALSGLSLSDVWAKGDRGEDALRGIQFEVKQGEIFGIGGVDGNGQVELAEVAIGVRPITSGRVDIPKPCGPRPPQPKIAYIPQSRQADGLALEMSIEDNMLIAGWRRPDLAGHGILNKRAIRNWSTNLIRDFEIKANGPEDLAGSLSGGNQQKVVVSRSLDQTPDLLVAVNPTRGLDIRAADFVHRRILQARDEGATVLLISTDIDELSALADRTLFISRGKLIEAEGAESVVGGS